VCFHGRCTDTHDIPCPGGGGTCQSDNDCSVCTFGDYSCVDGLCQLTPEPERSNSDGGSLDGFAED